MYSEYYGASFALDAAQVFMSRLVSLNCIPNNKVQAVRLKGKVIYNILSYLYILSGNCYIAIVSFQLESSLKV